MRTILLFILCSSIWSLAADEWTLLYPKGAPLGVNPPVSNEIIKERGPHKDGGYREVSVPAYKVMLPAKEKRTGAAVVVFPGGGYTALAMGHEGYDYAKWLVDRGIVAVLCKYRVSSRDDAKVHFPVPLIDARRAIRTARSNAEEWGIDPKKIGVMGSSAGGHLASMCATMSRDKVDPKPVDEIDKLSCAANFAILVYPVIGMDMQWGHAGSRRRLLGEEPSVQLMQQTATYRRVDALTPPSFLIHAADDRAVPLRNSTEFAARCAEHGVDVVCHVYAHGGHGFGLKGKQDSLGWPERLEEWLVMKKLAHAAETP